MARDQKRQDEAEQKSSRSEGRSVEGEWKWREKLFVLRNKKRRNVTERYFLALTYLSLCLCALKRSDR